MREKASSMHAEVSEHLINFSVEYQLSKENSVKKEERKKSSKSGYVTANESTYIYYCKLMYSA